MSELVNQDFIEIWVVWSLWVLEKSPQMWRGWGGQRKFKEIAREKMSVQKLSNSTFFDVISSSHPHLFYFPYTDIQSEKY